MVKRTLGDQLNQWIAPLAIVALGLLLVYRWASSGVTTLPEGSGAISQYEVRGMALIVHQTPYTLNFEQQTRVVHALNRAVEVVKEPPNAWVEKPFFDQLIVYRFNQPDLIIKPIEQRRMALLLDIPAWSDTHNFMDASSDELVTILKGAFGP